MYPICSIKTFITHKTISETCQSKPNLNCNYTLPIDLAPTRILIGAKSIGAV